jgi:hypothetical protein
MLERVAFTAFTLRNVFTANSHLAEVVSVKFAARLRERAVLCETSKEAVIFSVHQDGGRPSNGIQETLYTEASIAEI